MEWNSHRLAWLSGVEDPATARQNVLTENTSYKAPNTRSARSTSGLLTESRSRRSRRSLNESRLRKAIRKEIISLLREEMKKNETENLNVGLKTNSLTTSMGFGGFGFTPRTTPNRTAARTQTSVAFGGPGFM